MKPGGTPKCATTKTGSSDGSTGRDHLGPHLPFDAGGGMTDERKRFPGHPAPEINCPQCYARYWHFIWCPTLIKPIKHNEQVEE